ncbi:MAG: histidine phosphatase family protein [Paracoccaceae bacterium]
MRHSPSRRRLIGGALALALAPRSSIAAGAGSADLRARLRRGGLVVYFRHAATTWSGVDRIDWPRHRQRLLSAEGEAQSRAIGRAFREAAIPIGEVLASPFARCADMADIAFGRVETNAALLGLLSDREGRAGRIAYLRERLSAPPASANRVIVSHRSNIAAVADVRLGEGDAVVVEPRGGTGFATLAVLGPHDWAALATRSVSNG